MYQEAIRDIRAFVDFVKLYGLAALLGATYVAVTGGLQQGVYALLFSLLGLGIMYGFRREHLKGGLLAKFDETALAFEKIAEEFVILCHNFLDPADEVFERSVSNSHDLILKEWMRLMKRMRNSLYKGARDESIANLMREFLRIVDKYKERVILPFIDRANRRRAVKRGTKTEFLRVKQEYSDFVDRARGLVETMNSELKLAKVIEERPEKISQDLDVQEPSPSPAD